MKQAAHDHPKLRTLARLLNVRQYAADGIFDRLIRVTSKYAPRGDIGKWTDEQIAAALDWEGDATNLIASLVGARLLDAGDDEPWSSRLIVHDWQDHCEDSIHNVLARRNDYFANGEPPKLTRLSKRDREKIEPFYTRAPHARDAHFTRTKYAEPKPAPAPAPKPEPLKPPTPLDGARTECAPAEDFPGPRFRPEFLAIPIELETLEFRAAWSRWIAYLPERVGRISQTSLTEQVAMLSRWGPKRAIAAIEFSITSNYASLVEPKDGSRGKANSSNGPGQRYEPGSTLGGL